MKIKEITKREEVSKEAFDGAWFFSIAEGGAMGSPGEVIVVLRTGEAFRFNYISSDINFEEVLTLFSPLNDFDTIYGEPLSLPDGWKHFYLGAGNHLLVFDEVYERFYEEAKGIEPYYKLYGQWLRIAEKIIKEG